MLILKFLRINLIWNIKYNILGVIKKGDWSAIEIRLIGLGFSIFINNKKLLG